MKKVKIILINIFIITMIFSLSSCLFSLFDKQKDTNNGNHKDDSSVTQTIPKEYWGRWTRMDNGSEYYFDSSKIYVNDYELNRDISLFSLESDNVIKYENYRLFRKDGQNRSFSFELVGFEDTVNNARISLGFQDITGRRENQNNKSDSETIKPTPDGKLEFTDAVPGDDQKITITTPDDKVNQDIVVTPSFDDEVMGTLPLLEDNMYGFKITYSIDSDEQGLCYGNSYKKYNLQLNVNNIGTITCATSVYEISCDDPNFVFMSGDKVGNFSSIEPTKSKSLNFEIRYMKLDKEYIDVPIKISITDSKYKKNWIDTVVLRFYKGLVPLSINSRNFDNNSSSSLNGFVIYPDGRSKRFTVSNNSTTNVYMPWSEKDYFLVFSGASAYNEMGYSFGFPNKTKLADLSGVWNFDDINAYENNDSIKNAVNLYDYEKPIKAYLMDNDIDFYKINNSSLPIVKRSVNIDSYKYSDFTKTNVNNSDNSINPGETIWMDILITNSCGFNIKNLSSKMTCDSSYVTILGTNDNCNYGDLGNSYCSSAVYRNDPEGSHYQWFEINDETYTPYKFIVSKNAPYGTKLPFTFTFTDSMGDSWTQNVELEVVKRDGNIIIDSYKYADCAKDNINNYDNSINPGETIWMDILIRNKGSNRIRGITSKMTCDSSYVTILGNNDTCNYGDLNNSYFSSAVYRNDSDGSHYQWFEVNDEKYTPYKFIVSKDAPYGTKLPFTFTFTDSMGDSWTQNIELEVVKRDGNIVIDSYKYADYAKDSINNNDNIINPGETIWMDILICNEGSNKIKGITSKMTCDSSFVTILGNNDTCNYGDLDNSYCSSAVYRNDSESSHYQWFEINNEKSTPYKFIVSQDAPYGAKLPFTFKFTDSMGDSWTQNMELEVVKRDGNIVIDSYKYSDCTKNNVNNSDNIINPGETIWMDILICNKGSNKIRGITSKMTCDSSYVTILENNDNYNYGDLNNSYYSSAVYRNDSEGSHYQWFEINNEKTTPYKFIVSQDAPYGSKLPFTFTFTDSMGDSWTQNIELNIVR